MTFARQDLLLRIFLSCLLLAVFFSHVAFDLLQLANTFLPRRLINVHFSCDIVDYDQRA